MTPTIANRVRNRLKRLLLESGSATFYYAEERLPEQREPRRVFALTKSGSSLSPKALATRAAINKHLRRMDPACPPLGDDAILCTGLLQGIEDGFSVSVHVKRGCGKRQLSRGLKRLGKAHRFGSYDWLFDAADKPEPTAEQYAPWIAEAEAELDDTIALAMRGLERDATFDEKAAAERAEATLEKLLRRISKLDAGPEGPAPYAELHHRVAAALRALEPPAPPFDGEPPGWSDRALSGLEGAAELSAGFQQSLEETLAYLQGAKKNQLAQISKFSVELARMLRALASGAEMLLEGGWGGLADSLPFLAELTKAAKALAGHVAKATDIEAIRSAAAAVTAVLGRAVGAVDLVSGGMALYEAGARIHLAHGAADTLQAVCGDDRAPEPQRAAAAVLLERLETMERAGYYEGLLSAARICEGLRLVFAGIPLVASVGGAISALWTLTDKALKERAVRLEEGAPRREELLAREGLAAFAARAAEAADARGETSSLADTLQLDDTQQYLLAQMRASRALREQRFPSERARRNAAADLLPGKGSALVERLDLATAITDAEEDMQQAMLCAVGLTPEEWLTITTYAEAVVRESSGLDEEDRLDIGDLVQLRGLTIDSLVAALPEL